MTFKQAQESGVVGMVPHDPPQPAPATKAPQGLREAIEKAVMAPASSENAGLYLPYNLAELQTRILAALASQPTDTAVVEWMERHWHDWQEHITTDSDGWAERFGEGAWLESNFRRAVCKAIRKEHPALAPYVTAQPAPSAVREEEATPYTDALIEHHKTYKLSGEQKLIDMTAACMELEGKLAALTQSRDDYMEQAFQRYARLEQVHAQKDSIERDLTTARQQLAEARADRERYQRERDALWAQKKGEFWIWQGDGTDRLESLTCQVLIRAADLRAICTLASELAGALEDLVEDAETRDEQMLVHSIPRANAALDRFRSSTPAPAPAPDKPAHP